MYKKAVGHFKKVDPILYSVSLKIEPFVLQKSDNYFLSLCREIIGQQLNGKVARVIFDRFLKLFPNCKLEPQDITKLSEENIRNTGASWAKAKYIKDLAQKIVNGDIKLNKLDVLKDEEVTPELTKVKGIGRWTSEMFLMFSLGRPDIFSYGDLGLQKAVQKLYQIKDKPSIIQLQKISSKWKPYRTYASMILWRSLEI